LRYLAITNWEEYQGYKKGTRPDWIRVYTALLNPAKHTGFARLSDGAKLTLHHLRLLAAECDNVIPETWLSRERLNMQTKPKVDEVVASGFAVWGLSSERQDKLLRKDKDHLSLVSSASGSFDQEQAFGEIWADFLTARVPDPKHKALARRYFGASVKSPESLSSLRKAIANYRDSERVAKGFVQDASTFLHDWQTWEVVVAKPRVAVDGLAQTRVGVTADDVRELEREIRDGWHRPICTASQAQAWVDHVRANHAEDLSSAPTLSEYLQSHPSEVTA
jgi:hypothetical protein